MVNVVNSVAETAAALVGEQAVRAEKPAKADRGPSKADKAREIFTRLQGAPRKDVIAAFIAEAGLTKAGASTYYQNIKSKFGK